MAKHILFLQGAGEGAYEEDQKLAGSISQALGTDYEVHYPAMPDEDNAPYELWKQRIEKEIADVQGPIMLVGHSVGASVILKYLSEPEAKPSIAGAFLMAAPYWGGAGWTYDGYEQLELPEETSARIPQGLAVYLYHCRDDEVVPFEHLALYAQTLPQAIVRPLDEGGHQLNNDLSVVAKDVKNLR